MLFASASPTLTASSLTNLYLNVNGIIYLWFHPNLRYTFDPTCFRPPKPQLVFARLSISLTIWSCSLYSAPSRCSSQFIITSTTFSVLLILELLWKLHWWVIAVVMLLVMYPDWAMGIKLGQFCHLDGIALNLLYCNLDTEKIWLGDMTLVICFGISILLVTHYTDVNSHTCRGSFWS
jgi:hypothetical protein